MDNSKIIGLPVLISTRLRIVLSKSLCSQCQIPQNGTVHAQFDEHAFAIFPKSADNRHTECKQMTLGRFNIPIFWAKANGTSVGKTVFLLAADNCLQISSEPLTQNQCLQKHVYGIPVVIRDRNFVYIPKSLWLYYGIDSKHGNVIREEQSEQVLFQKAHLHNQQSSGANLHVSNCRIPVSPSWRKQHNLSIGDFLWLFGTDMGPVLSLRPVSQMLSGKE